MYILTYTIGQFLHIWAKAMACVANKENPPRTFGEYFRMRGAEVAGQYFTGLMLAGIVWVGADQLTPAWLANADPKIKVAFCGLLGYNLDSVVDKVKPWFLKLFGG